MLGDVEAARAVLELGGAEPETTMIAALLLYIDYHGAALVVDEDGVYGPPHLFQQIVNATGLLDGLVATFWARYIYTIPHNGSFSA